MSPAADGKTRVKATTKLSHLKFMQKAAAKAKIAAVIATPADSSTTALPGAIPSEPPSKDAEQWSTVNGRQIGGCRVITEDAPPPGALLGRISFGAFNPTVDALQAAGESVQATAAAAAAAAAAQSPADTSSTISDAAMAATLFSNRQKASEGDTALAGTAKSSTPRAEAARNEAMASMTGIATGPEHARPSPTATLTGIGNQENTGVLSLTPDAVTVEKPSHNRGQKKKQGRGLREGEEDIAPLRLPKRKKHGR